MPLSLFAPIDRWLAPAPSPGKVGWIGQWTFAHRGLHGPGVPENSLAAARGAITAGMGIECDIQRSLDDWPMVFHDWDLKRLLGVDTPTERLTADQLKAMLYPGSDEGPATLADFLNLVAGQVPLLIEIKSKRGYDVERTCALVQVALTGYTGHHAVMSFDPRVSRWFGRLSPDTVRGLVVTEENGKDRRGRVKRHVSLWHSRPDFLAYDIRDMPSRFAGSQRARGMPVTTWTVRSPEQRSLALQYADAPIAEAEGVALLP